MKDPGFELSVRVHDFRWRISTTRLVAASSPLGVGRSAKEPRRGDARTRREELPPTDFSSGHHSPPHASPACHQPPRRFRRQDRRQSRTLAPDGDSRLDSAAFGHFRLLFRRIFTSSSHPAPSVALVAADDGIDLRAPIAADSRSPRYTTSLRISWVWKKRTESLVKTVGGQLGHERWPLADLCYRVGRGAAPRASMASCDASLSPSA